MAIPAGLPFPALVIHCPSSETFESSATTTTSAEVAHGNTEATSCTTANFPRGGDRWQGQSPAAAVLSRLATIDWEWYLQIPLKPGWF